MAEKVERRLAAILSADVVGYTRLMRTDEEGTLARFHAHRAELVEPKIAENKGRIVKLMGDGLLVEFASVVDAVRCATEVQRGMPAHNAGVPEDEQIVLRVGINLGDVIVEGDDVHGDGVNIATRLQEIAPPGGISVSGVVYDSVKDTRASRILVRSRSRTSPNPYAPTELCLTQRRAARGKLRGSASRPESTMPSAY